MRDTDEDESISNEEWGVTQHDMSKYKDWEDWNTQGTTQKRILAAIQAKPEITQKELAQSIGITLDGIKYHIKNMTKLGIIKHEGSTKSGKWIILK